MGNKQLKQLIDVIESKLKVDAAAQFSHRIGNLERDGYRQQQYNNTAEENALKSLDCLISSQGPR